MPISEQVKIDFITRAVSGSIALAAVYTAYSGYHWIIGPDRCVSQVQASSLILNSAATSELKKIPGEHPIAGLKFSYLAYASDLPVARIEASLFSCEIITERETTPEEKNEYSLRTKEGE